MDTLAWLAMYDPTFYVVDIDDKVNITPGNLWFTLPKWHVK